MLCPLTIGVWYPATVLRCVDGDTVRVQVDVGGGDTWITHLRLAGINAPERKRQTRAAGDAAFLFLVSLCAGRTARVRNGYLHLDRYGRTLGDLELTVAGLGGGGAIVDAATEVMAAGYAVPWVAAA